MANLQYIPGEKLTVPRPVNRIAYIKKACEGKNVLDLGCYDETALVKKDSGNYLFNEISGVSALHIGVDNSKQLPPEGIVISDRERIYYGDIYDLAQLDIPRRQIDIIIAGELIEHLPDTLGFFNNLRRDFRGTRLICTTPNATSFSNMLLSLFKRESAHIDHLQVYSYKTLNTLCRVAGFGSWQIIPYHVKFTEMILRSGGIKKQVVNGSEGLVNGLETAFPMTAGGYIVDVMI